MTAQILTADDIRQLGTILSVWAHPDDESYSCAGIMCTALQNGQQVACVTATKGELGIQDESRWPAERLADIRAIEMEEALDILGIKNHHWLGYADGGCKDVNEREAVDKILGFIEHYRPDTILTFGPEGFTGHPDHQTISKWSGLAAKQSDREIAIYHSVQPRELYEQMQQADAEFNIFFNIDNPPLVNRQDCDIYFRLSQDCRDQKYDALCAMPSQTEAMFKRFGKDFICTMICCEAFVRAK